MTELRRRMDEDMIVRGLADRTRETYLWAVKAALCWPCSHPDRGRPCSLEGVSPIIPGYCVAYLPGLYPLKTPTGLYSSDPFVPDCRVEAAEIHVVLNWDSGAPTGAGSLTPLSHNDTPQPQTSRVTGRSAARGGDARDARDTSRSRSDRW